VARCDCLGKFSAMTRFDGLIKFSAATRSALLGI
jgi:hypothetical protein